MAEVNPEHTIWIKEVYYEKGAPGKVLQDFHSFNNSCYVPHVYWWIKVMVTIVVMHNSFGWWIEEVGCVLNILKLSFSLCSTWKDFLCHTKKRYFIQPWLAFSHFLSLSFIILKLMTCIFLFNILYGVWQHWLQLPNSISVQ